MAWAEKRADTKTGTTYWRGAYRVKDINGAQVTRHVAHDETGQRFTSKARAERAAASKEDTERKRPQRRTRTDVATYRDWINDYWWDLRDVEPATLRGNRSVMDFHILPYWGDMPPDVIDREDVQEWVNILRRTPVMRSSVGGGLRATEQNLSAETVAKIFHLFSQSMTVAVTKEVIPFSPCKQIELPVGEIPDEHFLTRNEFARLEGNARDDETRMVIRLGVGTVMRYGEMAGLHRHRIKLDERLIVVREVLDGSRPGGRIKECPKSKKKRGIPITDTLAERLAEYMSRYPAVPCTVPHLDKEGNRLRCRGALLFNGANTHLHYSTFFQVKWLPMVVAAGLPDVMPHDLRHTYASWLVQRGVALSELQELLGHATPLMTQRYAHLAGAHWDKVRAALDDVTPPTGPQTPAGRPESAPRLPPTGTDASAAKIIDMHRRRRSAG